MNRSAIRSQVRALANIYSTALLSDTDINTAISDANFELSEAADWPWLRASASLSVVAGDATYNLPAGCRFVLGVANDDVDAAALRRRLRAVSEREVEDLDGPVAADTPVAYREVRDGDGAASVVLYPTPVLAETLTVRYVEAPEDLDGDGDTPAFRSRFHSVLAYMAAARVLADRHGSEKKVAYCQQRAAEQFAAMVREYLSDHDDRTLTLGKGRGRRRGAWL